MNFNRTVLLLISFLLSVFDVIAVAPKADTTISTEQFAELIIKEAKRHIGMRYSYGGSGTNGVDCSGFTKLVYGKFGIELPHSSKAQAKEGRAIEGSFSKLQKGDLVVFGSRRRSKTIGHVGIFIELDASGKDFTFIHAATSGGVRIDHFKSEYYDGRFLCARRFIPDFVVGDKTKKDYSFDLEKNVFKPDTLTLKDTEYKIVLFENGKWAYVDNNGTITKPTGGDNIVLDPNSGNWSVIKSSTHTIPTLSYSTSTTTSTSNTSASTSSSGRTYHVIKSGDTLSALARKYHTTVKAICNLNGISERTVLKIGRKLRVK